MAEEVASDYGLEHYNELFIRRRRMLGTVPAAAHNQFHDLIAKGLNNRTCNGRFTQELLKYLSTPSEYATGVIRSTEPTAV